MFDPDYPELGDLTEGLTDREVFEGQLISLGFFVVASAIGCGVLALLEWLLG